MDAAPLTKNRLQRPARHGVPDPARRPTRSPLPLRLRPALQAAAALDGAAARDGRPAADRRRADRRGPRNGPRAVRDAAAAPLPPRRQDAVPADGRTPRVPLPADRNQADPDPPRLRDGGDQVVLPGRDPPDQVPAVAAAPASADACGLGTPPERSSRRRRDRCRRTTLPSRGLAAVAAGLGGPAAEGAGRRGGRPPPPGAAPVPRRAAPQPSPQTAPRRQGRRPPRHADGTMPGRS